MKILGIERDRVRKIRKLSVTRDYFVNDYALIDKLDLKSWSK